MTENNIAGPPEGLITQVSETPEDFKPVDVSSLVSQHRRRYVIRTSIGDLQLKHIGFLEMESICQILLVEDPDYEQLAREGSIYHDKIKFEEELSAQDIADMARIGERLAPYTIRFHIPCFEKPSIDSVDEYNAIMDALQPKERTALKELLLELSNQEIPEKVRVRVFAIAKEFGIPIATDLTVENMTAEQGATMEATMITGAQDLKKMLG